MTTMARNRFGNPSPASTSTLFDTTRTTHAQGSSFGGGMASGNGASWKQAGGIWGNTTIGSGIKAFSTESAKSPDDTSPFSPDSDTVTGSRSLLDSSERDDWHRQPNKPWLETSSTGTRSSHQSGSSPIRSHHGSQITPLQPLSQNVSANSSHYSLAQASAAAQGMKRNHERHLDQAVGSLSSDMLFEDLRNNHSSRHNSNEENMPPSISFSIGPDESPQQTHFPQHHVHSASMQLVGSSSRSGSLPPSRNGVHHNQIDQSQGILPNTQLGTFPPQGPFHRANLSANASFLSNGTQHTANGGLAKPGSDITSLNIQFGNMHMGRGEPNGFQQTSDTLSSGRSPLSDHHPQYISTTDTWPQEAMENSFNPNESGILSTGAMQQLQQYRNSPFSGSSVSVANSDHRRGQQSPYYSSSGTPPATQQHRITSRDSFGNASHNEAVFLERKLRGAQGNQQSFTMPPNLPFRGPYFPYNYPPQSPLRMNPLAPYYPMHPPAHILNQQHVPRGPSKDHDVGQHLRSPLLEEFRSNSKTNKRYELKDIYNHIVEFSGDQHGSRFIQQKLETANSDEKDQVFREIQPNAIQLMTDVFGNYVIQKFFEHGNQAQKKALANQMKNRVLSLSRQMYGCRVVQKALEHILTDQQASLIKELESNVMLCVKDQNGNHVVQKAIERVPPEHIDFIVNGFTGQIQMLSVHPYGCRVIQRMLEHCVEPTRSAVLQELHTCASTLIVDQYGNYVTQHIIEHGRLEDRNRVISLVIAQLVQFSKHKFASNVVEKCVQFSTYEQRQAIVNTLTGTNERAESTLQHLIRDQYGNYVIQKTLAQLKGDEHTYFVEQIKPQLAMLKRFQYSKQITAIEKMIYSTAQSSALPLPAQYPNPPSTTSAAPTPPLTSGSAASPQTASFPSTQPGSAGGPIDSRKSSTSNDVGVLTPTSTEAT